MFLNLRKDMYFLGVAWWLCRLKNTKLDRELGRAKAAFYYHSVKKENTEDTELGIDEGFRLKNYPRQHLTLCPPCPHYFSFVVKKSRFGLQINIC